MDVGGTSKGGASGEIEQSEEVERTIHSMTSVAALFLLYLQPLHCKTWLQSLVA